MADDDKPPPPPSPSSRPSKKKRAADVQLTKDDHDRAVHADDEEEGGATMDAKDDPRLKKGTFERASADVLRGRRILRVGRRTGGTGPVSSAAAAAAAPAAPSGDDAKKAAAEDGEEAGEEKEAAEGAGETKKEGDDAGGAADGAEAEGGKKNPFAAVSFASAAKANPFSAFGSGKKHKGEAKAEGEKKAEAEAGEEGADEPKTTKPVFGCGTSASAGFGAAASSTSAGGSVFGSGTGASAGFGAAFGSAAPSTAIGFGAAAKAAPTTGFGTGIRVGGFGAPLSAVPKPNLPAPSPTDASGAAGAAVFDSADGDAANTGEEDEERVFQARAKLFRMVPSEKGDGGEGNGSGKRGGEGGGATAQAEVGPSVPAATKIGVAAMSDGGGRDKKEERGGAEDEKEGEEKAEEDNGKADKAAGAATNAAPSWKEVGIGPLRILLRRKPPGADEKKAKDDASANAKDNEAAPGRTYRVVQRRESTPGGPGTKLILNVPLRSDGSCTVERQADKFVRLATVEEVEADDDADVGEGEKAAEKEEGAEKKDEEKKDEEKKAEHRTVLYLFKVKTKADADELQRRLEEGCGAGNAGEASA